MMGSTKRPGEGSPPEDKTPPLGTPALGQGAPRSGLARRNTPGELHAAPPSAPPLSPRSGLRRPTPPSGMQQSSYGAPPSTPPRTSKTIPPSAPKTIPPSSPSSYPPPGPSSPKLDFGLMTPAARVVDELLAVRPTDRMVIVHDDANADVAGAFEQAAAERSAAVERVGWGSQEQRPLGSCPPVILRAIRGATATVLAVSMEEGEYDARYALINAVVAARTRHVHMVGTGRRAFIASMMASTGRVFELLQALRSAMRPTSKLTVRSPAGTQLEVEMAPHLRWFANGHAVVPAQWINVPFGALISSPATVNGTYVVDAAIGGGLGARAGLLEGRAIRLSIEAGRVRRVECKDLALKRYVESFMAEAKDRDRVALLSLGANLGVREPLGEIVHDENMPGLHLALGDTVPSRTGAMWTAYGQLPFASGAADVDLDGVPLIRRARYVRFV